MSYNCLKIFHILSATLLLTSMVYSIRLWLNTQRLPISTQNQRQKQPANLQAFQDIQKQTGLIIIPCALIQLATGFTMFNQKPTLFSANGMHHIIIGFIIAMLSWLGFIYFLLQVQQYPARQQRLHFLQKTFLVICGASLLSIIFLMANRL